MKKYRKIKHKYDNIQKKYKYAITHKDKKTILQNIAELQVKLALWNDVLKRGFLGAGRPVNVQLDSGLHPWRAIDP